MLTSLFLRILRAGVRHRDLQLRDLFDRSLPMQDAIMDRWERAESLGFGPGSSVYNSCAIFGDVTVGENTWVGPNTLLDGSGGALSIGSHCSISSGVQIYTHDTVLWAISGGVRDRVVGPVSVGNCVYIGSQSIIAHGVTIGDRSVVAANSFVNKDVQASSVVGGSPARILGSVVGEGENVRIEFESQ